MTEKKIDSEKLMETDQYLRGYQANRRLLRLDRYEREFFGYRELSEEIPAEIPMARTKMFEIRYFIMSLKNGEEKLFLYYHYIRGESVEKCAELFGISRATAFRLKRRALREAAAVREERQVKTS